VAKKKKFEGFDWPDFTMTPNAVYRELLPVLSPPAFKVLSAIVYSVMYANREEGFAPISQAELVNRTGLHINTVRRALHECLNSGAVVILESHSPQESLPALYTLYFKPGQSPFEYTTEGYRHPPHF